MQSICREIDCDTIIDNLQGFIRSVGNCSDSFEVFHGIDSLWIYKWNSEYTRDFDPKWLGRRDRNRDSDKTNEK